MTDAPLHRIAVETADAETVTSALGLLGLNGPLDVAEAALEALDRLVAALADREAERDRYAKALKSITEQTEGDVAKTCRLIAEEALR